MFIFTTLAIIGFITFTIALVSGVYYVLWGRKQEQDNQSVCELEESIDCLNERVSIMSTNLDNILKLIELLIKQKENK